MLFIWCIQTLFLLLIKLKNKTCYCYLLQIYRCSKCKQYRLEFTHNDVHNRYRDDSQFIDETVPGITLNGDATIKW